MLLFNGIIFPSLYWVNTTKKKVNMIIKSMMNRILEFPFSISAPRLIDRNFKKAKHSLMIVF